MQLKKTKNVKSFIALASCSLIGTTSLNAKDWDIDNALLLYSESDDRVQAVKTVTNLSKELDEDNKVSVTLILDALTGASPNGASPTNVAQTFTSPSGGRSFRTPAGQLPLDESFRDFRTAISGNWSKVISQRLSSNIGLALSNETDYQSIGINGMLSFYTNNKNTTWQFGSSFYHDISKPIGGIPTSSLLASSNIRKDDDDDDDDHYEGNESESKNIFDINFGVTQVLGKNTIGQLSFSYSDVNGYQNDPYKILSFIDETTGSTLFYINEERPQKRNKKSVYTALKHHTNAGHTITPSFRFYTDDWGIDSFTADLKYRINLSDNNFIEPKIRYYDQSAAYFYQHSLSNINGLEFASADFRLAKFNASTVGFKVGHKFANNSVFEARFEYYSQNGDDYPDNAIGVQRGLDLFAEVKAIIVQFNYNLTW